MRGFAVVAFSVAVLNAQTAIEGRCSPEAIHDLGLPCSIEEPCPIYLELSDLQAVGDRLVLTGNLHTGTTTLESILLTSDDAGKSWVEAHPRIPMAALDHIQFYDFEAGWINGHMLQPTPKDPFFLISTDGGKTWRKRPIVGETRPGTIEQFWFDTRSHGLLLMDRPGAEDGLKYELWESITAGDSWSVRQVDSKPIALSRPPRTSAWRIRADAKSQTNRVEHQVGATWEPVASFRVRAGECKPPAPVAEPDPPPQPAEPVVEPAPVKPGAPKRPPTLKPKRTR